MLHSIKVARSSSLKEGVSTTGSNACRVRRDESSQYRSLLNVFRERGREKVRH